MQLQQIDLEWLGKSGASVCQGYLGTNYSKLFRSPSNFRWELKLIAKTAGYNLGIEVSSTVRSIEKRY